MVGLDPMNQIECASAADIDVDFPRPRSDFGRFSAYPGPDAGPFGLFAAGRYRLIHRPGAEGKRILAPWCSLLGGLYDCI